MAASQSRTILSTAIDASNLESGEKTADLTPLLCPLERSAPSPLLSTMTVGYRTDRQRWSYQDAQSANDIRLWYTVPPHEPRPADDDAFEYVSGSDPVDVEWRHASPSLSLDAHHVDYEGPRISATHASAHLGIWRRMSKTASSMRVKRTF